VGERLRVDQVADRVDLRVGGAAVLVDLDLAVLLQLDPSLAQPQRLGVGAAAAGDAEVVDLGRLAAVAELDRLLAGLDVLDRVAGGDGDVLFLKARSTTRTTSLSSAGMICGSISISSTSVPKRP